MTCDPVLQIAENFKQGHTGQLAILTCFLKVREIGFPTCFLKVREIGLLTRFFKVREIGLLTCFLKALLHTSRLQHALLDTRA